MEQIKEGGRAFPWCGDLNETPFIELGMTLRDYFAAKELAKVSGPRINDEQVMYDRLSGHCYRMADAMLRARDNQAAPEAANTDMLLALQEVLKTPGLQSGLQALCAAAIAKATGKSIDDVIKTPKFHAVYCSQCGGGFGPGDHGFSHCHDHQDKTRVD